MTRILIILGLALALFACKHETPKPVDTGLVWLDDFEVAKQTAGEKNLPILVDFTGSDWCIWCQKLDKEVFTQPEFAAYAKDNLVLVKMDFPKSFRDLPPDVQQKRETLRQQFRIEGFPTIMLLKADGTEIAKTGYQEGGAASYVTHLKGLLGSK
jgi:protein disulfide-isomerase